MPTSQLVVNTQTVPDNSGSTVTTPLSQLRTVTYILRSNHPKLEMPYAVEINGIIDPSFSERPKQVICALNNGAGGHPGKIIVNRVPPGAVVRLYLNSDAHPDYRRHPVFAVTPASRNVEVVIREKSGHAIETDALVRTLDQNPSVESMKPSDTYEAKLTGITWLRITHKYDISQVDALLPPDLNQIVVNAVKSIYSGLTIPEIVMVIPGTPIRTITVKLEDSANAVQNIAAGYNFLNEGVKRVHPVAFASFFLAAINSGVTSLRINSGWRPMLGSIAHRAGLGIDVSYLGSTSLNRSGLKNGTAASPNVTAAEKEAFRLYQNDKGNPEKKAAWDAIRNQSEPEAVKRFRHNLNNNASVRQIMDPWYMDINSSDTVPAYANEQTSANDELHKNHLHVTIHEPKIRGG